MPDWDKIKQEYIVSDKSVAELANEFGVSIKTARNRSYREKWGNLRRELSEKTVEKIIEEESDERADRMVRLLRVSDKLLEAVENAVDKFDAKELVLDKTALRSLAATVKDIKDIQNIKSELDIEEQKARIARLKSNPGNEGDNTSGVVLMPPIMNVPKPPEESNE